MIHCADETLERLGIDRLVDVVGHSRGDLSALAYAIERPERTRGLILVGSLSGFPTVARWGMPGSAWELHKPDYWRFIVWGLRVNSGHFPFIEEPELFARTLGAFLDRED
jgi:pimeloyl-ACP methyl ester carboxylesterase